MTLKVAYIAPASKRKDKYSREVKELARRLMEKWRKRDQAKWDKKKDKNNRA